jgi:hypothetical protein
MGIMEQIQTTAYIRRYNASLHFGQISAAAGSPLYQHLFPSPPSDLRPAETTN